MTRAYINGIGLLAPGLEGLLASESVLTGAADWQHQPLSKPVVEMLPANERRRTTPLIKLALQVAKMALDDAETRSENLASVFASSDGDFNIVHKMCEALCENEKALSPTQFHNSVHNAPAGYWAIAAGSHSASSSISAAEASFAAGLLESVVQLTTAQKDVLLIAYDYPPPAPLDKKCDTTIPFALALVLGKSPADTTRACLHIESEFGAKLSQPVTECQNQSLEAVRRANPAARGLPLLEGICRKQKMDIILPYVANNSLMIRIKP